MAKLKLYWTFYKSTIAINYSFSVLVSLFMFSIFWEVLPWCIMTGGPVIAFIYKEIACPGSYYFYYNQGISKIDLNISGMLLNILTGLLVFVIKS